MEIDINRSCRSCLCESSALHPICESAKSNKKFGSFEKDSCIWNMTIAEVIMACTVVDISPDDGLPQSVCSQCLHQIQQAFQFKEKCEAADVKLRRYSLNKADPISFIKTENDDMEQLFQPETVLVTEFDMDESTNIDDSRLVVKREKKQVDDSIKNIATKIKIERIPDDVDEKALVDQAQIVDGRYQCQFCEKSLADRNTFKLHLRLHTGTNLKRCTICDRGFAKKNHLERHMATHDTAYKCTYCTKAFATTDDRKDHEKSCTKSNRKDSSKVKSEDETQNFKTFAPNSGGILDTPKEESDADSFDPDYTNEGEAQMSKNVKVRRTRIPRDDEEQRLVENANVINDRYECPLCSKTLARKEILVLHIRSAHTGKNLLQCPICDKGFAKPYNLNRHMLSHCQNNSRMEKTISKAKQPDGSFCCTFCMKVFNERESFRLHLRLHTGNKLRHCDICNQSFDKEEELLEHMPVHGDYFPCAECDEIFKTFRDRENHADTAHSTKTKKSSNTNRPRSSKNTCFDDDDEDEQLVNSAELVNGRYKCKFCEKTLATRDTLRLHIRLHLQKKLKICEYCGHGFGRKSHLDRHMKTHFPKKPECKICHTTFESVQEQKAHTAATHTDEINMQKVRTAIVPWTQPNGKKSCQCMICDSVFDEISTLRNHLAWHANTTEWIQEVDLKSKVEFLKMFDDLNDDELTNENIAEILQTKLKDDSLEVLKMYRITNDQGWELSVTDSETENEINDDNKRKRTYDCNECPNSYDRLYKLMCHSKADHSAISKEFQCNYCLQCFPDSQILGKHLRQQCENETKTHHCTMCYSRFTWESSLDSHFAVYHRSEHKVLGTNIKTRRPYTCDLCSKSFYTEEQVNTHRLRHFTDDKRFACDICDKRFSRYINMRSHMRSHIPPNERETIAKTHLCSYCGQCFSNWSNLNAHIRKHTGERPFQCDICNSRFRRSCDLTCHRRTHTGEKPYPCTVCGYRFSRSNKLARHMRIHTGERRYKCTECDRAFTQSNDLTLHIRRHRGDKPFNCVCGERFITNSLLQQHRRTHAH